MARQFTRTRGRLGAPRRESVWGFFGPTQTTLAAGSTPAFIAQLNAAADALRPFTIVRVRGYWYIESDQVAASELYGASLGMAIVSDQAAAIGVTAVPTPATDKGSDLFFLYEELMTSFQFLTAAGFEGNTGIGGKFDSKGMRKVKEGEDFITTIETPSISNGCQVTVGYRFLMKLH